MRSLNDLLLRCDGSITAESILDITNIPSARRIRAAAYGLVAVGVPVVTDRKGYRLARSWDEVREYRKTLLAKAKGIMDHIRALDNLEARGNSKPSINRRAVKA